ncbi:hypothetical protein EGM88_05535 [Aureibaculum marinum]|uniref:Uncharacterized protein n=1 Tax=Aureibaculum marinum TaxID=2487930 RepID=A0A3N4PGJ1_9FLAO|nr:hypothetical protein [Aureibaculum marinum]RPD98653.1 hypothetical protein EGM88_05535 [Aureibaculum marinum]
MKQIWVYIFIILYTFTLIRPIVPVIEYVVDYDYIATVLCINKEKPELQCNGQCHLSKKIAKTLPIKTKDKQPVLPAVEFDKYIISNHNTNQRVFKLFNFSKKLNFFLSKIGKTKNYITAVFQPPDFLV